MSDARDQSHPESPEGKPSGRGRARDFPPDPPESPWRTLRAHEVYRNRWFSVTEYDEIRPDGQLGIYAVVDPGDNVTIVAVDDDERVHLIGEFLYALQSFEWGLPTGAVEPGEDLLAAAKRELAEETGLIADEWTPLGAYPLSPGIARQTSYIYLARRLTQGEAHPEPTERFSQRAEPLAEALRAVLRGEVRSAVAVIGLWRTWVELHPGEAVGGA